MKYNRLLDGKWNVKNIGCRQQVAQIAEVTLSNEQGIRSGVRKIPMTESNRVHSTARETFLKYGAPWIFYAAGVFFGHSAMGSAAAFLMLVGVCLGVPERTKPVEVVLGAFFLLVWIGNLWMPLSWLMMCQSYLAPALLALLAFGSLAVGSPFTLPYARESVPPSMWHNPHFFFVNRTLTALWGIMFMVCAWLKYWDGLPHATTLAISFSSMLVAALLTKWFPEWCRQNIYLKVGGTNGSKARHPKASSPRANISAMLPAWLEARGSAQADWHARAGALRDETFGQQVFVRAVIEVSNVCRQNCSYCGMRRDNRSLDRFRLKREILREIIFEHLPASVTDINFQSGEDPVVVRDIIIPLVHEIRQRTSLSISVCLGTLEESLYRELHSAGAEFYIIKIETGNEEHYRQVQAPGIFQARLDAIERLATDGWFVSSGFIHGLPHQTNDYLSETLQCLMDLPIVGNSVSPFIPGLDTPAARHPAADLETTLNLVATLRVLNPLRIIPAVSAMNILRHDGYERALRAGANLATINLTPDEPRENYLLYKKDRFIMDEQRVLAAITAAELVPSHVSLVQHLKTRTQTVSKSQTTSVRHPRAIRQSFGIADRGDVTSL